MKYWWWKLAKELLYWYIVSDIHDTLILTVNYLASKLTR
jgi:hypothetical protein